MTQEQAIAVLRPWEGLKIKAIYDLESFPGEALHTLIPNFEYPEYSHMQVEGILKKFVK